MSEGATDKNTAKALPDLKARLATVRGQCAALRGRKPAAKDDSAPWPRDLNAADGGGSWGSDPIEVRDPAPLAGPGLDEGGRDRRGAAQGSMSGGEGAVL